MAAVFHFSGNKINLTISTYKMEAISVAHTNHKPQHKPTCTHRKCLTVKETEHQSRPFKLALASVPHSRKQGLLDLQRHPPPPGQSGPIFTLPLLMLYKTHSCPKSFQKVSTAHEEL